MKVFAINSGYDGCSYLRILLPTFHCGFQTDRPSRLAERLNARDIQAEMRNADVVVFHRPEDETHHNLAKMLKRDGKKIVMDNDDTFNLDSSYPLANLLYDATEIKVQERKRLIDEFMGLADLVTTTTPLLAEEYARKNPNVVILPNCVDPFDWPEPSRNEGDKVRIGLVGSVAIESDYLHIKGLIRRLSKREDITLVLFGLGDAKHRQENPAVTRAFKEEYAFWDSVKKEQVPWCKNHQYQDKLNEARLDLMLIPRKDNYFNRCKSNIKFLEAAMLEIPVIAQSFAGGPYEEITPETGVLIKDNRDWQKEIDRLVKNRELRRSMGRQAREYALKNYNIADHAPKWAAAYEKLYA